MKLIAAEGGRNLDRIPLEELRPSGGVFIPEFIRAIVDRYQFTVLPSNLQEAIKDGVKFEHGKMTQVGGDSFVIKELAVYSDGIIADCFDTDMADIILDDFFAWASETFKLRERTGPIVRTRISAVVVELDRQIEPALGKMAEVCTLMSEALKSSYGWDYKYEATRLAFAVDPLVTPHLRNTNFILERRVGIPYSGSRWFSAAPLRTSDHLRLLETIEGALLS